ncbi:hypothetical protein BDM02DRAFT_3123262 [Thelephora ganbajun]|uniref:Uncharacterized protein n=1 Tax=Thelephora ganbajun TaxID=370292 RepID=A0ACB6Z2H4_THEGA|nr:hypothetical protein BDM02DRAFT_3123262 [Thelephora ganbajun]
MSYIDDTDNSSFYSVSSTSGQFDLYPVDTFTDGWRENGQPGYIAGPSTSLRAQARCGSPDSSPSAPSYAAQTLGYEQFSYPEHYWPTTGQYTPSHHSGIVSRDNSFTNTVALEVPMMVDHNQRHSTTGETTRAAHPQARSMW